MKYLAIILMLPFAARAQLVLATGGCSNGSPDHAQGRPTILANVAAGAAQDVSFFVCNPRKLLRKRDHHCYRGWRLQHHRRAGNIR